jgi:ankyrin repeat protein
LLKTGGFIFMKLLKFILPITAMLMVFAVVESTAQICVYEVGEEYKLEDAIKYKGNNLEFIKFCCDSLRKCTQNYYADNKYLLTHIAAKYNRTEVLEYLVKEKRIPADTFPIDLQNGGYDKSYTQIMFAAKDNGLDSAKYLISVGASVTRKNIYNQDALDLAKTTGNSQLIATIKKAWNDAKGIAQANLEKNKKDLIKVLTLNDIEKELKNFKRDIKFNGFFG